ncbi:MAG: AraC family transcriptional regulator [Chitinophagaceae bacterium]
MSFFSTKYFQRSVSSALETFDSCLDDPEFCRNTQYEFFQRICQSSPDTASLFHSLAKYVEMGNSFATEELLLSLIEKFLRDQASDVKRALSHSSKKVSTRVELYRRAALAFDYIHSSYSENLSLEQLASITHIAPFHLIRVFKEYFKITPIN